MRRFLNLLPAALSAWLACAAPAGAGLHFHGVAGGGASPATYVSSAAYHANVSGTVAIPAGAVAGDLVLVNGWSNVAGAGINSPGNASAAYTPLEADYNPVAGNFFSSWWRVLNAADITDTTIGYSGFCIDCTVGVTVYRGPTTATWKQHTTSTATSYAVPGFTPSGSSMGVVILIADFTDAAFDTLSASGFTQRLAAHPWSQQQYSMDQLSGYAGGSVTVSGHADSNQKGAFFVELTP